ncbi:MAG: hypothetical protein AAF563_06950 [Pseudomonadota bacterium]
MGACHGGDEIAIRFVVLCLFTTEHEFELPTASCQACWHCQNQRFGLILEVGTSIKEPVVALSTDINNSVGMDMDLHMFAGNSDARYQTLQEEALIVVT